MRVCKKNYNKNIFKIFLYFSLIITSILLSRTTALGIDEVSDDLAGNSFRFNPAVGFFVAIFTLFLNYVYDFIKSSQIEIGKSSLSEIVSNGRYPVDIEPIEQEDNTQNNVKNAKERNLQIEEDIVETADDEPIDVEKEYEAIADRKRGQQTNNSQKTQQSLYDEYEEDYKDEDIEEFEEDLYDEDLLELEKRLMGGNDDLGEQEEQEEQEKKKEQSLTAQDYLLSEEHDRSNGKEKGGGRQSNWKEREEFEKKFEYTKSILSLSKEDDGNDDYQKSLQKALEDIDEDVREYKNVGEKEDYSFIDGETENENVSDEDDSTIDDFDELEDFEDLIEDEIDDYELDGLDETAKDENQSTGDVLDDEEGDFTEQELNRLYDEIKQGKIFDEDDDDDEENYEEGEEDDDKDEDEGEDEDAYDDELYQEILKEYNEDIKNINEEEEERVVEIKNEKQEKGLKRKNGDDKIIVEARQAIGDGALYQNKKEGKVVKVIESEAGELLFEKIQARASMYRLSVYYSALIWSTIDVSINDGELIALDILAEGDIDELKSSSIDVELQEGYNNIRLENNSYQNVLIEKIVLEEK